jgi:Tol biopolymer transport system component
MSPDGRFVSFASYADNLVPGDTNATVDIFRRDLAGGQVTRVSIDSTGAQTNDKSTGSGGSANSTTTGAGPRFTWISPNGNLVVFDSAAPELDADAANAGVASPFLHVMSTGETIRLGLKPSGANGSGGTGPVLSADMATVAYMGTGLSSSDQSGVQQCYIHALTELQ